MKKKLLKPHFRFNFVTRHPAFIYDEISNEYKYIGITHSPKTHGLKNKPLHYNPNPKDPRKSYMRPFSTHLNKKSFSKYILKGYKLHKADKKTARKIKQKYKQ